MTPIRFPNIRKLLLPDPGKVICDCDLSGADAQVVAWEANDKRLMSAFAAGLNVHNENGTDVWGADYDPKKIVKGQMNMRDQVKRAVHGTNYGASPRTLANTLGWKIIEADSFQKKWFTLHPEILAWHRRTDYHIQSTRTVSNIFGYRRVYFDRPDGLLPQALAWTPQSTVALICARGAVNLSKIPWLDVLIQVHDSVVFQIPFTKLNTSGLKEIKDALRIIAPYKPEPLYIPWDIAVSEKSWGDVAKINWEPTTC